MHKEGLAVRPTVIYVFNPTPPTTPNHQPTPPPFKDEVESLLDLVACDCVLMRK